MFDLHFRKSMIVIKLFILFPIEDEEDEFEDRGHWGSKAEFILSCVGFSVSSH